MRAWTCIGTAPPARQGSIRAAAKQRPRSAAALHQRARYSLVHQPPSPRERVSRQVRPVREDVSEALLKDLLRPAGLEQAAYCEAHQQVADGRGIEDAGVVESDEGHYGSVPQPEPLRLGRQLIERRLLSCLFDALVGEQVGKANTTAGAYLAEGDLSPFEQAHEERTRYVEQVGCLLRRQFGVNGHDGHCVAVRHLRQDLDEQLESAARDLDGLTLESLWPDAYGRLLLLVPFQKTGEGTGRFLGLSGGSLAWRSERRCGRHRSLLFGSM